MPNKLTPQLNDMQLKQNIDALQKGGMQNDKVQEYVNNYTKDPSGNYVLKQAPAATSNLIKTAATAVADTANAGVEQMRAGVKSLQAGPTMDPNAVAETNKTLGPAAAAAEAGGQVVKAGEKGVADLGGVVGGAASVPLAPVIAAGTAIGNKIGEATPLKVADWLENIVKNHPITMDNVKDIGNMANLAFPEAISKAAPAIDAATAKISDVASQAKEALTPKPPTPEEVAQRNAERRTAAETAKTADDAAKIKKAADEWVKPTLPGKSKNPAGFNNARVILKKNPEVGQVLAENKLHPQDHITETGHYATEESAKNLVQEAGQRSYKFLRPALEAADPATPLTPVEDVFKSALGRLDKSVKGDVAVKEDVQRAILSDLPAFKRAFPNGMKLSDLHDQKIKTSEDAGYSAFKSTADNNSATAKRNLSSALGKMVEQKAPPDLPVHDFNTELQKLYEAADYLKALNNKKAPESLTQVIANRGSSVIGAAVGHHIGGGLLGGVGGYIAGGVLEKMVANMVPKYQAEILSGLKQSDPAAFTRVSNYIQKAADERAARVGLPEGKPLGSPENPRPMGSGPDKSSVKSVPAQPSEKLHRNYDVGRFDRAYHQTPKK